MFPRQHHSTHAALQRPGPQGTRRPRPEGATDCTAPPPGDHSPARDPHCHPTLHKEPPCDKRAPHARLRPRRQRALDAGTAATGPSGPRCKGPSDRYRNVPRQHLADQPLRAGAGTVDGSRVVTLGRRQPRFVTAFQRRRPPRRPRMREGAVPQPGQRAVHDATTDSVPPLSRDHVPPCGQCGGDPAVP